MKFCPVSLLADPFLLCSLLNAFCLGVSFQGNMKYNEYNTASLNAVGGKTAGLTMTVATMQLGVCALYAIIMWIVRINPAKIFGLQVPAKQKTPKISGDDVTKTLPVGFCSAAAHACTVFALGGDPLFGQIVKSGEPVLSALVNTVFYGKPPSSAKVACLPIIVGGVAFASLKKSAEGAYALKFDQTALLFGMLANTFAAFKGSENKKLMSDSDIAARFAGVGNQVSFFLEFFYPRSIRGRITGSHCSEFLILYIALSLRHSSLLPRFLPFSCVCQLCLPPRELSLENSWILLPPRKLCSSTLSCLDCASTFTTNLPP